MKVSRRRGRLQLRLEPPEVALLGVLFDQLDAVLDDEGAAEDEVRKRLQPAAYRDDAEAEAEFRSLTEESLRSERTERIALCRADLARTAGVDLGGDDTGRRWIQVLNDLRLALGTRLGVTEHDNPDDFDLGSAAAQPRVVYYWLTAVQDEVVRGLMR